MDLSSLLLGAPTDVAGFEKELNGQMAAIAAVAAAAAANAQDIEELIADALKRRCTNGRKEALHMHLRLKTGANAEPREMTRRELGELAELVAAKGAANAIIQRLANFYARIAMLRARIEAAHRSSADPANHGVQCNDGSGNNGNGNNGNGNNGNGKYEQQLLAAHAKNEESLREKRDQNQRELDRIMRALFPESDTTIHPALTEDDLPALELQVEHIAERGCTAQELRRVKIVEALLEQRRLDALLNKL
jgi:hypothetical protein